MADGDRVWVAAAIFFASLSVGLLLFSWLRERREQRRQDAERAARRLATLVEQNGLPPSSEEFEDDQEPTTPLE